MNIFDGIEKQNTDKLLKCLNAVSKIYKKGEIIFNTAEEIPYILFVENGCVQLTKDDINGNEFIVARIKQGEIFAESFACTKKSTRVRATTLEETKIIFLDFKRIFDVCPNSCPFHKKILENLIKGIALKNLFLQDRIEMLSKKTLRERILSLLQKHKLNSKNDIFEIPYSREQMSQFLCVNRSALSRELAILKKEKIIDYHKNLFRIYAALK